MSAPVLAFRSESKGVQVDLDQLVSSRMLIQANSGGGKSRMLRYILEQTHGRIPQVIIDPEGEFASLREKFDYLLAGRDGDVPADPKTAKVLCRRIAELGASCVIDIYELEMAARRKFVRLFLEELVHLPRSLWHPQLLVIDEAHLFCPERGAGEAESTQAVINACTLGRKRGIASILATQRISKLHKDAAAELLNKLVGRTGLDVDVKRAGDELGFDKEQRQLLKFLEPGTFYAFGPAIAREVIEVRSGPITTTHPQPGKVTPPAPPAPAAVKKLVSQLQDLQAKANDEARTESELREQLQRVQRRVKELERGKGAAEPDSAQVQKQIDAAIASERRRAASELQAREKAQSTVEKQLRAQIADLTRRLAKIGELAGAEVKDIGAAAPVSVPPCRPAAPERRTELPREAKPAPEGVTRPQYRILEALASLGSIGLDQVDKSNVAVFSGQSPTSSGFANNLGALRSAGLIDYPAPGQVSITEEGMQLVGEIPDISSLDQLHKAWFSKLPNPQVAILEQLIENDELDRDELAELSNQSPTSSGYANNLGRLRSLGLIDYPSRGRVKVTDLLFPEGLA